jgi:selenium metabolism protein YedF
MEDQRLDCMGLACPQPVLKVKEVLDRGDVARLTVTVDNEAARENVSRLMSRMGYQVSSTALDGGFEVTGIKDVGAEPCEIMFPAEESDKENRIAILVGTDRMGTGDDVLGTKLLFNFLATLKEMGPDLWRLIFLNAGVKFTVEGSDSLSSLQELEGSGIHILVCGTCLNYFELLEKKRVGETTNMLDIVTALQLADKVISLT